jgi:hypothetical protein
MRRRRLFVSGSDRDCMAWMRDYELEGAQGLSLHHFYRAVAWLGEELEDEPRMPWKRLARVKTAGVACTITPSLL